MSTKLLLHSLWKNASVKICADGGANHLFNLSLPSTQYTEFNASQSNASQSNASQSNASQSNASQSNASQYTAASQSHDSCGSFIPDLIMGDLDSLDENVQNYYRTKNVEIVQDLNQDTTDFQKCMNHSLFNNQKDVYVVGALGGRFDHIMAALHTLYLYPSRRVFLLGNDSAAMLLQKGSHVILSDPRFESSTCGLFPLSGRATCITRGLEWDLDESMPLQFGGLISTSNKIIGIDNHSSNHNHDTGIKRVQIECRDEPCIWTVELKAAY